MKVRGRGLLYTRRLAETTIRLRFVVLPAWLAAAVLATLYLPTLGETRGAALGSLVPADAPALRTQLRSADIFRLPILANTAVVQRDADGLSTAAQRRTFERAVRINRRGYPDLLSVAFALPLTNTLPLVPGSREEATTAITYLYFDPSVGLTDRHKLAHWFADRRIVAADDALVGVTGVVPGQVEQGLLIEESLPLVELATVLLIALVIGANFRSVGAPVMTLAAVGVSYLVAVRVAAWVGEVAGVSAPRELEPIVLVLLLGIVTDYSIFFLSGFRRRLAEGEPRLAAATRTTEEFTPIILVAGLIVAAGTASLAVAELEFFRIFGPGLALTVLVGLAVAVTFVPASLAIGGRALLWPSRHERRRPAARAAERAAGIWRTHVGRIAASRRTAALVAVAVTVVLLAAGSGVVRAELAPTPIEGLPGDNEVVEAADAAAEGFARGILSPTLLLLEDEALVLRRGALVRLQDDLELQPGVAAVVGPRGLPPDIPLGAVIAPNGAAVRYIIVLNAEPLSSEGIGHLKTLRARVPQLLAAAGLEDVRFGLGGNTALAEETVATIVRDLGRIGVTVLAVNLVLLVLFLRAFVAPLYLLAASVLALLAALGLTTYLFQGLLGQGQLTYYVPFMAAVLLVSLGSDYNVFLVGRIWQEARGRPLAEAIAVATPHAAQAINAAGVALAASFALLAIVPLSAFREFAFAMSVGVLLDAFLVRPYLVPALVALVGGRSMWPGRAGPHPASEGAKE